VQQEACERLSVAVDAFPARAAAPTEPCAGVSTQEYLSPGALFIPLAIGGVEEALGPFLESLSFFS